MKTNEQTENGTTKKVEFSKITVDHVKNHAFKEEYMSCQLRQVVTKTTIYNSSGNDKQDNLFTGEELGKEPTSFENTSVRICWMDVPAGTKSSQVEERLSKLPNARIYQIVSTDITDLLNSGQLHNISEGILELDLLKNKYSLKDREGNLVKDRNGNQIYRWCYFSSEGKEDIINVDYSTVSTVIENDSVA